MIFVCFHNVKTQFKFKKPKFLNWTKLLIPFPCFSNHFHWKLRNNVYQVLLY